MKAIPILLLLLLAAFSPHNAFKIERKTEIMKDENVLNLVRKNNIAGVTEALKKGADVNTTDNNKNSLLLLATHNQSIEMAKILLKFGANLNQQASNLDSPFLYAGATGQTELLKLFLAHGPRFDIFNRYNGSALIPACERGHVATVALLVSTTNFPINHVNKLGWTALMEAVILGDGSKKYQEIVQLLKDNGAKMDIPDHDGITPLQHAKLKGFSEIASIIQS